jgi:ActR/RegA family two-component response regulator
VSASIEPTPTPPPASVEEPPLSILAIVGDEASRAVFPRVLATERLTLVRDLASGLAHVRAEAPDVAFVDVTLGEGAGLAMVHHVKAVAPDVTVFALATAQALEIAANAVALGGSGLMMLPLAGDEILNAVASVKLRRAERGARTQLEASASYHSRAAGWIARVAELAEAPDRPAAARQLVEVLLEATGAAGAVVYLAAAEGATELARTAATPNLERAPAFGAEMDILKYARAERLLVLPLGLRLLAVGHVLLLDPDEPRAAGGAPRIDGLLRLLVTQAATSFALLGERDRSSGGSIKDPKSSAYSFAYYVDVAGREIDRARRHGRRFAIATVAVDAASQGEPWSEPPMTPSSMAEHVLNAVRDTDIVARVDEHELHVLLPETDGLGAHACRRRVLSRLGGSKRGAVPPGVLVGVATFPHDGQDLSQLLRMARRRAEASKASIVHRLAPDQAGISDVLEALEWDSRVGAAPSGDVAAARPLELPIADAASLAASVVADALRGGATLLAVAHHPMLSLGAAVRSCVGAPRDNVVLHALDVRSSPQCEDIEALSVIAEHGAYALIARNQGGVLRGVHAADPLLADLLAERLGRAAGLRVFS